MKFKKSILIYAFVLLTTQVTIAQTNTITVDVEGFKNNNGRCLLYIHNKKEGFPNKNQIKEMYFPIVDKKCVATITLDTIGVYSITALHDENSNNKMDDNFFGKPKEGFGVSNNRVVKFKRPTFEEASFTFDGQPLRSTIRLNYY